MNTDELFKYLLVEVETRGGGGNRSIKPEGIDGKDLLVRWPLAGTARFSLEHGALVTTPRHEYRWKLTERSLEVVREKLGVKFPRRQLPVRAARK